MRLAILMFWLRASILSIVNSYVNSYSINPVLKRFFYVRLKLVLISIYIITLPARP